MLVGPIANSDRGRRGHDLSPNYTSA